MDYRIDRIEGQVMPVNSFVVHGGMHADLSVEPVLAGLTSAEVG